MKSLLCFVLVVFSLIPYFLQRQFCFPIPLLSFAVNAGRQAKRIPRRTLTSLLPFLGTGHLKLPPIGPWKMGFP